MTLISNNCWLTEIGWIMQFQVCRLQKKNNWMTSTKFHIPTLRGEQMAEGEKRRGIVKQHMVLHHPGSIRCRCPAQSCDRAGWGAAEAEEERHSDKRVKAPGSVPGAFSGKARILNRLAYREQIRNYPIFEPIDSRVCWWEHRKHYKT